MVTNIKKTDQSSSGTLPLKQNAMSQTIGNIKVRRALSRKEQEKVVGGQYLSHSCSDLDPCNLDGWCCANHLCIETIRGEDGRIPFCHSS